MFDQEAIPHIVGNPHPIRFGPENPAGGLRPMSSETL